MCRYDAISEHLRDFGRLLGCPRMLPLNDIALDDVERP